MHSSVSTGYKRTPAPGDAFNLCHRQDRMTKLMASTEHPVDACLEPTGATGYGPRVQCREPGLGTRPVLFHVRHSPSEHHDTRLTTERSKIVDTKSVHKPRVMSLRNLTTYNHSVHYIQHMLRSIKSRPTSSITHSSKLLRHVVDPTGFATHR